MIAVAQLAGTARPSISIISCRASSWTARFDLIAVNLGSDPIGRVNVVVGWKKSTWDCKAAGMLYSSVRMLVVPLSTCVKILNCVLSSSFAFETGMVICSMSPAGEIGFATMLFPESHSVTAAIVSCVGLTKSAT